MDHEGERSTMSGEYAPFSYNRFLDEITPIKKCKVSTCVRYIRDAHYTVFEKYHTIVENNTLTMYPFENIVVMHTTLIFVIIISKFLISYSAMILHISWCTSPYMQAVTMVTKSNMYNSVFYQKWEVQSLRQTIFPCHNMHNQWIQQPLFIY